MEKVLVVTKNIQNQALGKLLSKNNYSKPVVIRMDGNVFSYYNEYPLQVNSLSSIETSFDEVNVKERIRNYSSTLPVMPMYLKSENLSFPFVLKARTKKSGEDSVFYIEDSNDYRMARSMTKRFILEPYYRTTTEYRMYCSRTEVFYAEKRKRIHADDHICNSRNSVILPMAKEVTLYPKLWSTMQKNALTVMSLMGLDIAAIDFLYNSTTHGAYISRVNASPLLNSEGLLQAYANQIDKIIKAI